MIRCQGIGAVPIALVFVPISFWISCSGNGKHGVDADSGKVADLQADEEREVEINEVYDSMADVPADLGGREAEVVEVSEEPAYFEVVQEDVVQEVDAGTHCLFDEECDDQNYCTMDVCKQGQCLHIEKSCNDGNLCTDDVCNPVNGQCMHVETDCDDGNYCTWDSCMPTVGCQHQEIPGCCQGTEAYKQDFEAGSDLQVTVVEHPEGSSETWQVSEDRPHSGNSSLYFGNALTKNYDCGGRVKAFAETPPFELPSDKQAELWFWVWMDVEPSKNYDTFEVLAWTQDKLVPLWGKDTTTMLKTWVEVKLDIRALAGQKVTFRFQFDSIDANDNDYEGIYIDDIVLIHGCTVGECKTKVECSDNLLCINGKCVDGQCQYEIVPDCCLSLADCLDSDPCTLNECKGHKCSLVVLKPPVCCYGPEDCDDGNECTQDICDGGICKHPAQPGGSCCKQDEECEDGNVCTDDKCDLTTFKCNFVPNTVPCDDSNKCTTNDKCSQGVCSGTPIVCDDKLECTQNLCDPDTGCFYPPEEDGKECDDGNICTAFDKCLLGECVGEWVKGCCLKVEDCDDGNKCTVDKCKNNKCTYAPMQCDDKVECTQNLCDPDTGCYYPPIPAGEPCDDGNICTTGDVCVDNKCVGNWIKGCCLTHADCADGDDCTQDYCKDGKCLNYPLCCEKDEDCNDFDDLCTQDTCVDSKCVYTPTGAAGCCHPVLFRDDFSQDLGWEYGPEWERGKTTKSGVKGLWGNDDPADDHSGSSDGFVAGVGIGDIVKETVHTEMYWLTSPVMPCAGAQDLKLTYWRWLNTDYSPYMKNRVEVFNGSDWVTIWSWDKPMILQDNAWKFMSHDVTAYANANFRVRFGFSRNNQGAFKVTGWNVDDVVLLSGPPAEPGLCCDWDTDCEGILEEGYVCIAGACTLP